MMSGNAWISAVLGIALIAAAPMAKANLLPDGGFESGKLRKLIHWRSGQGIELQQGEAFEGDWCLRLGRGEEQACTTIKIPVKARKKYRLSFVAKVVGPGALATDAPYALQRLRHTEGLARWRVAFSQSTEPSEKVDDHRHRSFFKIIHNQWTEYHDVFYVPPDADQVKIVFSNGSVENKVLIDQVELVAQEDGPLNVNPEVSLGRFNYSGYNYAHQAPIVVKDDGSGDGYLDTTHGWVIGDPVPIEGGRRYQLHYRARHPQGANHNRASLRVRYCDAAMEKISDSATSRVRSDEWTKTTYEFVPPAEARFVRLIFGSGDFDWFRLETGTE